MQDHPPLSSPRRFPPRRLTAKDRAAIRLLHAPLESSDGTLEDALLDPARAEEIRASVDGEWLDVKPSTRVETLRVE